MLRIFGEVIVGGGGVGELFFRVSRGVLGISYRWVGLGEKLVKKR